MMTTHERTLADAFYEILKDVYFAEIHSVKTFKTSAKTAVLTELKAAFDLQVEESAVQVERLAQIFQMMGKSASANTCDARCGMLSGMDDDLDDVGSEAAGDAVVIACGLALKHFEVARYGILKTWAIQLGMTDAAKLLDETLQEARKAVALLSAIAREIGQRRGEGQA